MANKKILKNVEEMQNQYINREHSWLAFNERILALVEKQMLPLFERLRFLSIAANNLDEFHMVRMAKLYTYVEEEDDEKSIDGLTALDQIPALQQRAADQVGKIVQLWRQLRKEMIPEGIEVVSSKNLTAEELVWLEDHFLQEIYPVLTPMAIDISHPLPLIPCRGISFVVQLESHRKPDSLYAFVPIPFNLDRFIRLPGEEKARYVSLEHTITFFMQYLFNNQPIKAQGIFRVIRDSEMDPGEGADFIVGYQKALRQRLHGHVIQLAINARMPENLRMYVAEKLDVSHSNLLVIDGFLGINDVAQLIDEDRKDLLFPNFSSRIPQRIKTHGQDIFDAVALKDILIHHPYESFEVVVNFINQAARDPDVVAIKQTVYRTGYNSKIVAALIEAAKLGKSVTVVMEIKARFDEEINIKLARDLEESGVHVVYGVAGMKTHAKMTLVMRREGNKLKTYAHFGTGNYNARTAKIYVDLSLLTADPKLCQDGVQFFHYLTGYAQIDQLQNILIAPFNMRPGLLQLIQEEINRAQEGKKAAIWAKMNALTDKTLIDKLYEASKAGVEIDLIIRGICCLKPGIPGLSETIRVKSIVGRFLEHARVFCFANGSEMPSLEAKVYIASADWMPRNLDWRLELMIPIMNQTVKQQIVEQVMFANINDRANSWELGEDGNYRAYVPVGEGFNAHDFFLHNSSLSGSGMGPYDLKPRIVHFSALPDPVK